MTRRGSHGGATLPEVAAALGISEDTVARTERRALARLEIAITMFVDDLGRDDLLVACLQRLAYSLYCGRLMACPPGEAPDDEPPCGV